jgi:hypothetical protein
MSLRKRLAAGLAAVAAVLAIGPIASAGADPVAGNCPAGVGIADPGPLGPAGPYGEAGPWGPAGPMHGQPNPLGDTAQCGGFTTFVVGGGTVSSFVNANLASVGIIGPAGP